VRRNMATPATVLEITWTRSGFLSSFVLAAVSTPGIMRRSTFLRHRLPLS
jgi:hypothetical protein